MKIYLIVSSLFFVGVALLVGAAIAAAHRTRTGFILELGAWQMHVTWRRLAQPKSATPPTPPLP